LNEDLVENVLDECTKKYFNQSYKKELILKSEAEKILKAIEGDISPDMVMSDATKKIYLFQDAVTNMIVPCFNIENLPAENESEFMEDRNCVIMQSCHVEQPKTAAISNALRLWGRIFKAINMGETVAENNIDMETKPDDYEDEEVLIMEDAPVRTLADKEDKPKRIDAITVFDDEPRKYVAKGYLAFNQNNPTEIEIISPFGSIFDNWFMKLVNKLRASDKVFAEELELFLMEKAEAFKDTIAFGNDLDVQLFDDFPVICNDKKYVVLKKAIKDLSKDVDRIRKGEDESTNFVKNMRTAIEVMFRIVIQANPDIAKLKTSYHGENDFYYKYKYEIRQLVETNRLNDDIKQRYIQKGIYTNMINPYQGNTKDNAALILLYANKNSSSHVMKFVKDYDHIFVEILDLINLGNDASHGGKKYTEMHFSKEEAEQYYSQYENIVRALYNCLVEGDK
jgi:hypothetical protein